MPKTCVFPVNILVLVSGGGTNLQALIDAQCAGRFGSAKIAAVVSNKKGVYALERAKTAGIQSFVEEVNPGLTKPQRQKELSDRILRHCREKEIRLIVLAGLLLILKGTIIDCYSGRIINIHPALLPKFGGEGMYGKHVHRAVLAAGETETGCTVHIVDAGTDTGPILLQRKVPVLSGDTPEVLAERVLKEEHIAIVDAVEMMLNSLEGK